MRTAPAHSSGQLTNAILTAKLGTLSFSMGVKHGYTMRRQTKLTVISAALLVWTLLLVSGCMPVPASQQEAATISPLEQRSAVTVAIGSPDQLTDLPITATLPPKDALVTATATQHESATLPPISTNAEVLEQSNDLACRSVLPSRLWTGALARVTITNGLPLRVRNEPGVDGRWIESMDEGTRMTVHDGSVCLDGMYWWQIESTDGLRGWAAEADDTDYFIEPLSLPDTGNISTCSGAPESLVSVGDIVKVITYQVAIRETPGTASPRVNVVARNREIEVLDGPGCSDGMWWWLVEAETGAVGWVAEGDTINYYILPYPYVLP